MKNYLSVTLSCETVTRYLEMRKLLLLCVIIWSICPVAAQVIIRGSVTYTKDNTPVEGAIIKALSDKGMHAFSVSDSKGRYSITIEKKFSKILIVASHISYKTKSKTVKCIDQILDFHLLSNDVKLKEITIKAPIIQELGDTISYNLSSFKGEKDYKLKDAIKKLPGIEVGKLGNISYMGKEISNFYIDGMNMLGGQYGIAMNNIPSEYVSRVEVLRHHNNIKINNDQFSDKVAINIKMKRSVRFRPVGSYEAAVGNGEGYLFDLSGSAFLFTPHQQIMFTLRSGNIYEFSENESRDYLAHITSKQPTDSRKILGNISSSQPYISRKRFISPLGQNITFNSIRSLGEDKTLKLGGGCSYSKTEYNYADRMDFISEGIKIERSMSPYDKTYRPNFNAEYKNNAKERYLKNIFKFKGEFSKSGLPQIENRMTVDQTQKYKDIFLENSFQSIWNSENVRWSINSNMLYCKVPTGHINITAKDGISFQQTADNTSLKLDNTITAMFSLGNSRFHMPLQLLLQRDKDNTNYSADSSISTNELLGQNASISFNPHYEYTHPLRKYMMSAGVKFIAKYNDYANKGSKPIDKNYWKFRISPNLYLNYSPTAQSTFRLMSTYSETTGDMMDFLTAGVRKDNTIISFKSGIPTEIESLMATFSYNFKMPIEMLFINSHITYLHTNTNKIVKQEVSPSLVKLYDALNPNSTESLGGGVSITKFISPIHTTLKASASLSNAKQSIYQNNILYDYDFQILGTKLGFTTKPWNFIEMEYSFSYNKNKTKVVLRNNNLTRLSHNGRLKLIPHDNFVFSLNTDINRCSLADGSNKTMSFLDLGATWSIKKWRLSFDINNLFDQKNYTYSLFSTINEYSYNYKLRGREYVLRATFTL